MTSKYGSQLSRLANDIRGFPFRLLTYALLVCFLRTSHMFLCRGNVFDLSIWLFFSCLWLISGFVRRENAGCAPARTWKTLKRPMAWKSFAKSTHISSAVVRVKQGNERYTHCKFPPWTFTGLKMRHSDFMFMFLIFPDSGQLVSLSRMWNLLQPSSLVPFVRLFWLLHRKPAHSPSRTINWALSRYGTRKVFFILQCSMPSAVAFTVVLFSSAVLALDLTHGVVYCFVCRDNVYDLDLEKVGVEQAVRAWKTLGKWERQSPQDKCLLSYTWQDLKSLKPGD